MRILIQKCLSGSVVIQKKVYNEIKKGYVIFVGFTENDSIEQIKYLAKKVAYLRIFEDELGKMNRNIMEENGEILSISQFTLYANTTHGNRPSFIEALKSEESSILYDLWNEELKQYRNVKTGIFGSDMIVNIENYGPTTIFLEKE